MPAICNTLEHIATKLEHLLASHLETRRTRRQRVMKVLKLLMVLSLVCLMPLG